MARFRVMYWKEIPLQVQAEDGHGQISLPLDERFQAGADAISMFDGSNGTDDYLEGFQWGAYREMDGSVKHVAEIIANRFNLHFPKDFVSRIRDINRSGLRDSRPGVVDHWTDD